MKQGFKAKIRELVPEAGQGKITNGVAALAIRRGMDTKEFRRKGMIGPLVAAGDTRWTDTDLLRGIVPVRRKALMRLKQEGKENDSIRTETASRAARQGTILFQS